MGTSNDPYARTIVDLNIYAHKNEEKYILMI